MLVIKNCLYDGEHEPCYVSYYRSEAAIRADEKNIKSFLHELASGEDDDDEEEGMEYDEDEPSVYVTVMQISLGLNTEHDMMSCFYDPKRDAEETVHFGSGCTYTFAGNPNQFAEWVDKKEEGDMV